MKTRRTWVILPLALLAATVTGPVSACQGWILEERPSNARALLGLKLDTVGGREIGGSAGQPEQLIGVRASVACGVAMQQVGREPGAFQLRDVDSLALPATSEGALIKGPRNLLMLLQELRHPLRAGNDFDLTLYYGQAEPHRLAGRVQALPEVLTASGKPASLPIVRRQTGPQHRSLFLVQERSLAYA